MNRGMKVWLRWCVAGASLMWIGGCDVSTGSSVTVAQRTVEQFYQAIKNKNFEQAAMYCVETPVQPVEAWVEEFQKYHEALGDLEQYELASSLESTIYSGKRYTLKYKTKYSKHTANETFILFESVREPGVRIEKLSIRSAGLGE